MTIRTSPSSTPTIDILSLLQEYDVSHAKGSTNLKSCIWDLTKARRERGYLAGGGGFGGVTYSALDVREELRARAVLECEWEEDRLELVDEDETENDDVKEEGAQTSHVDTFVLHLDGMKKTATTEQKDAEETEATNLDSEGLRRRSNVATSPTSVALKSDADGGRSDAWTTEEPLDHEEERLRNVDPLSLFGLPPTALKAAQENARKSLARYVEAANFAAEIIRVMNQEGSKE